MSLRYCAKSIGAGSPSYAFAAALISSYKSRKRLTSVRAPSVLTFPVMLTIDGAPANLACFKNRCAQHVFGGNG